MRVLTAALAGLVISCTAGAACAADPSNVGNWSIGPSRSGDATHVQLRLEYFSSGGGTVWNSSWSNAVALADAGIPAERLRGPIGPVSFTILREPGSLKCAGSTGEGSGAGQFTYVQNARFDDALATRGMGRPTFRESLELAIGGVTLAFVDRLRGAAQHATTADVVRVVEHGVTPKYIDDLAAAGYHPATLDEFVRLRDHGVSVEFIRAVQQAGYKNLSTEDLVRLADHGVRERFIAEMRAAGFTRVSADELVMMRDHGVTPDFVGRLKAHGYTNLSVHDLIRLRDAGL